MENKIDWKNNIITALISIVVTVAGGAILIYFQNAKTELTYSLEKIEPFDNQSEKLTIFHIQIVNSGSSIIEDIEGCISLDSANIAAYKTSSQTLLKIKDSIFKGKINISIKSLNSDEKCKISILAKSLDKFPKEPNIQFRAKGLLGIKTDLDTSNISEKKILKNPFLLILVSSIFVLSLFSTIRRVKPVLTGSQNGSQKDILSYLFGVHNLITEVDRLISMSYTTYCSEADRLGFLAVNSIDVDYQNKIKSILIELTSYADAMATDSKAICYFNIAKIENLQQNTVEANKYLQLAKNGSKYLIERRIKIEKIEY